MESRIDFSVFMITYNHENFIEQAIRSVLEQEFEGSLQIVIGVDKSKDNTLQICKNIQAEFPRVIELYEYEENIGMFQNFYNSLEACKGKYIAILEGDDYWTYKKKLQEQFDYFEKHPNCILSAGHVDLVDEHSVNHGNTLNSSPGDYKILLKEDLVVINQLNALTTAFRHSAVDLKELQKLKPSPHLDWGFYLSLRFPEKGYINKFNKIFGSYRQHAGGVYSQVSEEKKNENILKTIFSICALDIESRYKNYLQALFANYSLKLSAKKFIEEEPVRDFYKQDLLIYNENGKLKKRFIKELYQSAVLFLGDRTKNRSNFKLKWELLRQTRPGRKTYFNLFLMPLYPVVMLLKKRESTLKNNIARS